MKKLRRRRKPAFNLRMFDLANDDNSQKDSLELYWDALEQTDAAYEAAIKICISGKTTTGTRNIICWRTLWKRCIRSMTR